MFRFANPDAFKLFFALIVIFAIAIFYGQYFHNKFKKAFGERLSPFLTKSLSKNKRNLKFVLKIIYISLMIIALARPQSGEKSEKVRSLGVEIFIAVDVSQSMLTEDVKPSRIEQAKAELNRLVDLMPGNKIGVLAFAGSSALLSPLTSDIGAIKMYIDSLDPNIISNQGTNFESALQYAKDAFERGGVTEDASTKVTRVVVIASDGEDHEPGALDRAQELAQQGIRIFTVAYGTEKGGAIPVRDAMGFLRGYKKDRSGQTVLSVVKGDALKALAEAGKGSFYFSTFGGNHIKLLVEDIGKLEKSEFDSNVATLYDEQFQPLLFIAILLFLIDFLVGERVNRFYFWKGRFEVPPA